ncbi:MAG: phosphate acyltransferase PlsX [Bacteroidetes bacterium]|jgi:glycerol-3-phosphate acyltransferase PlsX|nr:phosphate acyltransferase PlsX [Bacteroidota bacterium]MBT7143570.1 phosphate acyltransferase PlsX [Bacteroidota bacterium]MBT7491368.1 phosphate acyltransferase PlsX [Bacteroidota bacterium]
MRIGIDIMGGDFAPNAIVKGTILAHSQVPPDTELVLFGDSKSIKKILDEEGFDSSNFEIVHTTEVIEMGDHPAKSFAKKQNSSIAVGFHMLHKGKIDGFASAGNTGAMLVGAMYTIKQIPGVIRPSISTVLPKENGKNAILLDVGINPDCRPDVLYQYAILGSIYAEFVYKIKNPRIGLLNIGSEEEKGNLLTKATHELMKGTDDFNFIGNIEGNEIFSTDKVDVIVSDGFTGNVVLKQAESFYTLIQKRKIQDEYFEKFNFEIYGGTPILGVNAPVVIGHGISNDIAIKNMILHTDEVARAKITEKIKEVFNNG